MCQTFPYQIKSKTPEYFTIQKKGEEQKVFNGTATPVEVGDWVLVGGDLIIEKISPEEATDLINLMRQ